MLSRIIRKSVVYFIIFSLLGPTFWQPVFALDGAIDEIISNQTIDSQDVIVSDIGNDQVISDGQLPLPDNSVPLEENKIEEDAIIPTPAPTPHAFSAERFDAKKILLGMYMSLLRQKMEQLFLWGMVNMCV